MLLQFIALWAVFLVNAQDVPPTPSKDLDPDAPIDIQVIIPPPEGCSRTVRKNDDVSVHYTGWLLANANKFDSSRDRGQPFKFRVGVGQVIKGWDEGVLGACAGEKRKLTIPSGKGYGPRGYPGVIPAGATLVFDVELISIVENEEL